MPEPAAPTQTGARAVSWCHATEVADRPLRRVLGLGRCVVPHPGDQSWEASGAGAPAVGDPCPADQAADGDDRVGKVKEGADHAGAAFVAAGEPVEGVL